MAAVSTLKKSEPESSIYSSEKEAVTAAVNQHNPVSIFDDREFIGAIYETGEGFKFSVVPGTQRADQLEMRVSRGDVEHIVAFWHTHGNSHPKNRYFSDADTNVANTFAKPLYLAEHTGYLKVFEPDGKTLTAYNADRLGLPRASGYSVGKLAEDRYGRPIRVNTRVIC